MGKEKLLIFIRSNEHPDIPEAHSHKTGRRNPFVGVQHFVNGRGPEVPHPGKNSDA
jgi:hypothetical protein